MVDTLLLDSGRVSFATPAPGDGETIPLSLTAQGRLRVETKSAAAAATTTALTAVGNALSIDVSDVGSVVAHAKNTGVVTMAAGAFTFEASLNSTDGTDGDWFAVQAVRSNAATVESVTPALGLAAGAALGWSYKVSVAAYKWFRVRCSTAVTATAIAAWTVVKDVHATEPAPAVQSHPVTITGTVPVTSTTTPASGTAYSLVGTASTNPAVVKASAGSLMELSVFNPTAAIIYLKLYNKTTAPTVGTDVPYLTIPVPVNGVVNVEFGPLGKRFATGIGVATTTGPLATDAVAPTAGIQISATYL